MTENPGQGTGPVRIGDAEREQAVNDLGEHFAAGRITDEEHAERTEQAYAARTQADLNGLFADLPRQGGDAEDAGQQGEQEQGRWGPPWAQQGQWGSQWGQQGPPPWVAAWQNRPPDGRGPGHGRNLRWLPVPFFVLAAVGTACALAHGFFPFFTIPLLAIAVTFLVLGKRGHLGGCGPRPRKSDA